MAALTPQQVLQFHEEGFLVVEDLFDPETDIGPVLAEYEQVLDRLARDLHAKGLLASTYAELPFSDRLIRIYEESGTVHPQYFDFSLPQNNIREDTPMWTGPAVFNMIRHPKLLDAIESIIGPEIYSNPVQHIRIKPPESRLPANLDAVTLSSIKQTPWHQDQGVIKEEADESEIVTVWFPLRDATEENGCLAVVPKSHQEGLVPHCPASSENATGFGVHIKERVIEGRTVLPVPVKAGSALFMTKETIHSSLRNLSDHVRISFDLRYNPIGQPTGRPDFPGFVARSNERPDTELHDVEIWSALWQEARRALAKGETPKFNRWDPNSPACA
ncbi:MAG: phytanoyl-CoA dioxygenase family protein [Thermomicrobiales bacterium]|nr:phytanoyl-CoA dioxygenase family protein [Thermomicrobiales bacterium]